MARSEVDTVTEDVMARSEVDTVTEDVMARAGVGRSGRGCDIPSGPEEDEEDRMGHWHISIQGIGPRHNHVGPHRPFCEADANIMAADLVAALRKMGHSVSVATFTYGGLVDLSVGGQPKEALS
jgi:hypothetical protein